MIFINLAMQAVVFLITDKNEMTFQGNLVDTAYSLN